MTTTPLIAGFSMPAEWEPHAGCLMAWPSRSELWGSSLCGAGVTPVEIPINDSWSRDSGPAFVRHTTGTIAVVGFGFNAWGNRWHPHDDDARLSERIADHFGLPFFKAPFVLEGGSFFVDCVRRWWPTLHHATDPSGHVLTADR